MVLQVGTWVFLFAHHYEQFYPVYGPKLQTIISQNCSQQFTNYVNMSAPCTPRWLDLRWPSFGPPDCAGYDLLECVLETLPETAKSDMAAAGIVLGLLPVILSLAGSTTAEIGLLALRRPFLAAAIGLASPAVNPMRTFDYRDPFGVLRRRGKSLADRGPAADSSSSSTWSRGTRRRLSLGLRSAAQYLIVAAALGNLSCVAYDLTKKVIVGNDPNRDYQAIVWALWAFAIHVAGAVALLLRVKFRREVTSRNRSCVLKSLKEEFVPCAAHSAGSLTLRRENYWFISLAWATSIATIVHIVYGTLSFSEMLFLSGGEGMAVLLRCLASVAVCRMVLIYELHGMSQVVDVEPEMPVLGLISRQGSDLSSIGDSKNVHGSTVEISYSRVSPPSSFQDPYLR